MDSGNSGSMQSSSCGDEIDEYDSRAEPNFSMFLNNSVNPPPTTTTRVNHNHFLNTPSSSLQHHHTQMFDPSLYMDSLQKSSSSPSSLNQNSFLNLDMVWSKATARSEPNNTDLSSLMVPLSSSQQQQQQQAFLLSQLAGQTQTIVSVASVPTTQQQHSLPQETSSRVASLTNNDQNLNNNNNNNNMVRNNPKKRSRASRRAPTTVLTTDTTNFRAMVQEFTGIPAPPFSSPFPRTRLDLFGSSRSISTTHMEPPPPPYLLRPFAQKIQPFSPMIPSSSFPSLENLASSNNNSTNSGSINYHLSQQQNLHHPLMQHNQILGFQSISQAPTKYPIGVHQPSLEISPSTINSRMKMGTVFEEIGLSHVHVNNNNIGVVHHQNNNNNNNNNMRNSEDQWGQRTSTINGNNNDGERIVSGNEERVSNGTDFGVEKGQECAVTTRGEGTVESWINCSSSD